LLEFSACLPKRLTEINERILIYLFIHLKFPIFSFHSRFLTSILFTQKYSMTTKISTPIIAIAVLVLSITGCKNPGAATRAAQEAGEHVLPALGRNTTRGAAGSAAREGAESLPGTLGREALENGGGVIGREAGERASQFDFAKWKSTCKSTAKQKTVKAIIEGQSLEAAAEQAVTSTIAGCIFPSSELGQDVTEGLISEIIAEIKQEINSAPNGTQYPNSGQ
jgi:hypothetical protein